MELRFMSTKLSSYKDTPWPDENIVFENENIIVYKDGYPVTEGHLLFVPKRTAVSHSLDIMRCFETAYRQGTEGVENGEWDAFNVGINNGEAAGQSVMWPHVHLIPRRKGDTPNPRGGVRHVIPCKGNYQEKDDWKERYKGYREWKKKIPMEDLARLEEEYPLWFQKRFDRNIKDSST
jgi:diadenosine tetraphosphate (Ap4A) HIT family hydrolase